jgi:hypothetical protein
MSSWISPVEQSVTDYARSRLDVAIPPSLVGDIQRAVATAPSPRISRFSPLFMATTVAAAVAVLAVALMLIQGPSNIGPDPFSSAEPTPTPQPSLTPEGELSLTAPGDVVRIPAMDVQGRYGTITLERGNEVGGYEGNETPMFTDSYFVEVHFSYELDRAPDGTYGVDDWAVFEEVAGRANTYIAGLHIDGPGTPQPALPNVARGDDDIEGWLTFALDADAADSPMWLAYMDRTRPQPSVQPGQPLPSITPENEARAHSEILLRQPGEPVGITPTWTPPPGMEPPLIQEPEAHAEADALFAETTTCAGTDAAYEIDLPASWFADPTCSVFGPAPVEEATTAPIRIAPQEGVFEEGALLWDIGEMTIVPPGSGGFIGGGYASYFEWEAQGEPAPVPPGERMLAYEIFSEAAAPPDEGGTWWLATTTSVAAASDEEYELNKAVLHRLIRSMRLPTEP